MAVQLLVVALKKHQCVVYITGRNTSVVYITGRVHNMVQAFSQSFTATKRLDIETSFPDDVV